MSQETEIKLLLKSLPQNLIDPVDIEQIYIDFKKPEINSLIYYLFPSSAINWENIKEARVRQKNKASNISYFLTLKTAGDLNRTEHEVEIKKELYNSLISFPDLGKVYKKRFLVATKNEDITIEIDQYSKPKDLLIAEIEFNPTKYKYKDILEIVAPYFKKFEDVTFDPKYKNANLAKLN